jgi:eukaryotic-like serine/threonine-protein kinase
VAAQLGQYTLVEKIGEGGMGAVYRARHALLQRPTAIKLLLPERTNELDLARFEREVQLTSQLTHPNTIAIYDFGRTPDKVFYYAMEYIDGISLEQLVDEDGPQPPARVIHMLVQACGALAEAHGVGLIHRDVKPANLLLCARGGAHDVIKVVDFGLIKDTRPHSGPAVTIADTIAGTSKQGRLLD